MLPMCWLLLLLQFLHMYASTTFSPTNTTIPHATETQYSVKHALENVVDTQQKTAAAT